MYDIQSLRRTEFPICNDYIYFNHASISPLPTRTRNRVQWVAEKLHEQPNNFWGDIGKPAMETLQAETAEFLNAADPKEIALITSTSSGINAIAQSIDWRAGDNILFCEIEFPSNAYPWFSLERDGVEIRQVTAVNGGLTLEALKTKVDDKTRLVTVSAIQFFSGHRTDLAAIGRYCRNKGILFVVDAIQAIGHLKLDVQAMNIDVLVTGGQKSLLSLPGTGFMYVRKELADTLNPRNIGPNATKDFIHWLHYDLTFLPGAERFNSGTPNLAGLMATSESLQLLKELGVSHIDKHTTGLSDYAIEQLEALDYEIITPCQSHGPITTFKTDLTERETDKLVQNLRQEKITVVKHLDAVGTPHIRLSFHCYNTFEEIDRFTAVLKKLR